MPINATSKIRIQDPTCSHFLYPSLLLRPESISPLLWISATASASISPSQQQMRASLFFQSNEYLCSECCMALHHTQAPPPITTLPSVTRPPYTLLQPQQPTCHPFNTLDTAHGLCSSSCLCPKGFCSGFALPMFPSPSRLCSNFPSLVRPALTILWKPHNLLLCLRPSSSSDNLFILCIVCYLSPPL